jgi:hypothetical protein
MHRCRVVAIAGAMPIIAVRPRDYQDTPRVKWTSLFGDSADERTWCAAEPEPVDWSSGHSMHRN